MRKFVNKEGQVYFVSKDFELDLMKREGYEEVEEKEEETKKGKNKTEK